MATINQADACCSSCATTDNTALAITCTLDSTDLKARADSIRDLASRHLLSSRREPLRLHLTYSGAALPEVENLVARESECCAFLDFDIKSSERVELTITAPESATLAADELFAHFAPELAQVAA
ncbi:MAG TPA: hypothetical protein VL017_10375 [Devosia sp.]|nr:hypothetical protein [Devosia sp.]